MSLWLYTTVYIVFIVHHHNQHLYTCIHCVCYYHLHLCHNHCVPCLYTTVSIYLFYCFYPSIHYCRCTIVYILLETSLCLYTSLEYSKLTSYCVYTTGYILHWSIHTTAFFIIHILLTIYLPYCILHLCTVLVKANFLQNWCWYNPSSPHDYLHN